MQELCPNILDNKSLVMKYIQKLLIGTFLIATFGWYPPIFTEHNISTSVNSARSVYAADVDGNMDVLFSSSNNDTIINNKNEICLT